MSEVDSPAPEQPPEGADSPGTGQEPAKTNKSDPEQRLNGLMSTLGTRTTERDQARAERDAMQQELTDLRAGLDSALTSASAPPPPPDPAPERTEPASTPADVDEPRYTLREAQAVLEANAPVGHVDRNNPLRSASDPGPQRGLDELRRQLDERWADAQRQD